MSTSRLLSLVVLAASTPALAEPPHPRVTLEVAAQPVAGLYRLEAGREPQRVCDVPGATVVSPGRFVFGGPGLLTSPQFEVTGENPHLRADVRLGSEGGRAAGFGLVVGGAAITFVGLVALPFAVTEPRWTDSFPTIDHGVAKVMAPVMLTAGVAAFVTGVILFRRNGSELSLAPLR